jgi:hypothetical protein
MAKNVMLCCDRIEDRNVLKAVFFAIKMIRSGTPPNISNSRAAKYYSVPVAEVAHFVGQHSARIGSSKRAMQAARDEEAGR